jgi:glutathione S-transferase
LAGRTYLVGEGITIADLAIAALINQLYTFVHDENQRKKYQNLLSWYQTVSANPAWV